MEDMRDDAIDRFLKSWKGMLFFSMLLFGLYGLLVYGLKFTVFGGEMQGEPPAFVLFNFLFGVWTPWVMASPFAGCGCFFIYAAYHEKTSATTKKSIHEEREDD